VRRRETAAASATAMGPELVGDVETLESSIK